MFDVKHQFGSRIFTEVQEQIKEIKDRNVTKQLENALKSLAIADKKKGKDDDKSGKSKSKTDKLASKDIQVRHGASRGNYNIIKLNDPRNIGKEKEYLEFDPEKYALIPR